MEKTPYSIEFLWNQLEFAFHQIKKPRYKNIVKKFIFDDNLRKRVEKLTDKSGRNYEGGLLEKTASVVSISLCIYDNFPEINIDIIISAIILNCFCKGIGKHECFEKLKDYDELIPFIFKKKRKKPTLEILIYDSLYKLDNKIYQGLRRKRGEIN